MRKVKEELIDSEKRLLFSLGEPLLGGWGGGRAISASEDLNQSKYSQFSQLLIYYFAGSFHLICYKIGRDKRMTQGPDKPLGNDR
jgi:hypothetical protein